jgi:hypothetical protein
VACRDCGETETGVSLGGLELCDRCADRRTAEITGLPLLPELPPSIGVIYAARSEQRPFAPATTWYGELGADTT